MAAELGNLKIGLGVNNSRLKSGLSDAIKLIEKFAGTAGAAFGASEIAEFVEQLSDLNIEANAARKSFDRFESSTALLESLRRSTGGAVSDLRLMQQSIKAVNLGIDQSQLAKFFEFATIRAAETGESVDYLVTSIVNGVGRRSPLILDNLGIGVNKLGSDFRSAGDAVQRVVNIIDEELGKSAITMDEAVKQTDRLNASIENLKLTLAESSFGDAATAALASLNEGFTRFVQQSEFLINVLKAQFGSTNPFLTAISDYNTGTEDLALTVSNLESELKALNDQLNNVDKLYSKAESRENARQFLGERIKALNDVLEPLRAMIAGRAAFEDSMKGYGDAAKDAYPAFSSLAEIMDRLAQSAMDVVDTNILGQEMRDFVNNINPLELWEKDNPEAVAAYLQSMAQQFSALAPQILSGPFGVISQLIQNEFNKGFTFAGQNNGLTDNLEASLKSLVTNGLSTFAEDIGSVFGDSEVSFGEGILKGFASFLVQFGRLMVGFAIAKLNFENLAAKIGGAPGILAAGIAAIAIGSAIKASMKNAASAASGGSGAAAAVAASGTGVQGFPQGERELQVNIFVDGQRLNEVSKRQSIYSGRLNG